VQPLSPQKFKLKLFPAPPLHYDYPSGDRSVSAGHGPISREAVAGRAAQWAGDGAEGWGVGAIVTLNPQVQSVLELHLLTDSGKM
jgi:hypothetical protein